MAQFLSIGARGIVGRKGCCGEKEIRRLKILGFWMLGIMEWMGNGRCRSIRGTMSTVTSRKISVAVAQKVES